MNDETEAYRRRRITELETYRRRRAAELGEDVDERKLLEKRFGQVWDTDQLREEFEAIGFLAPFVVVRRKSDGVKGSLEFQHSPRFYFNWQEDKP